MSEQTLNLIQSIRHRLHAISRRITLAEFLYGLVLTLGILSAIWLVSTAIEAGFWLGTTPRTVIFWVLLGICLTLVGYFLLLPLLRFFGVLHRMSEEDVAERIGSRYPEVSDRLVNMLHLIEGRSSSAPQPLIEGAVQMLGEQVRQVPFEQVETFERAKKASRLASLPIVGLLIFSLVAPGTFLEASKRLFSPGVVFNRPAPFQLQVSPGSIELVRGSSIDISIAVVGSDLPSLLLLELNNLGEDHHETIELTADSSGVFTHTLPNQRQSLRYRVSARPIRTDWYTLTVTERPLVRDLQVALDFPSYTGIPPQRLAPNVGDVTALPGTLVSVEVGIGGPDVSEAFIQFEDGSLDTLAVEEGHAEGAFHLQREGSYHLLLRNDRGVENGDPISYSLNLLSDAFPSVVILEPDPLVELDEALRVGLRYRLNDDFGFRDLRLHYRLAESRFGTPSESFDAISLPFTRQGQLDQEHVYDWLLTQATNLDPVDGDVIEYYLQVRDNDAIAGYKSAKSATHRLRLPSLMERYENLDKDQDEAEQNLEDLLEDTESIRKQFQELRDELRRKQEGEWEDQRQLERLQEQQQQLEERVDDLANQMESITNQMEENNLVDEETLEMYQEMQRVAEEINSPELMEALQELQQAMEQLDLQQMQQAIENFEFNEEMFQQRLERTKDLFENLLVQQKLDEASRRAEELADQQERLAEETSDLAEEQENQESDAENPSENSDQTENENQQGENTEPENRGDEQRNEELAAEQERAKEEMEALQEHMEEIEERMQEMNNAPSQEMQNLNQDMQQQQIPQQMQENAEQLQDGQFQDAQQGQQQMQQQLQQLQGDLSQMQQGMQGQQLQINTAAVRQALSDILTLSQQQEALRADVNNSPADSPRHRDQAQRQVELSEGLRVVSDSLQNIARDIPQMTRAVQQEAGDALRAMNESTTNLAERSSREAVGQQKSSMMHLNELALLLSDLLAQMQGGQGQGGGMSMQQMLQQLQNMAGQQQQLNQQIQQMLNETQGQRLSQDLQQRMRQMAAQQDALRRQLKDMSRNRDFANKALGDLNKIAQEMEESIQEMQGQQVNRRTVQRQQRILTRLLNAAKSMNERGQEKRREGSEAEEFTPRNPGELPPAEQADQLRRALLRALESGYAPDYEELIKRYFELLQDQSQE